MNIVPPRQTMTKVILYIMCCMNHIGIMNRSCKNKNRVDGRTRTAESRTIFVVVVGKNVVRVQKRGGDSRNEGKRAHIGGGPE